MVSLKILTLLSVSLIATDRPWRVIFSSILTGKKRFLDVSAEGELMKG